MQQWRRWIVMKENGETNRMVRMKCECGRSGRDIGFFEGAPLLNPDQLPEDCSQQRWACSSLKQPEFFILD